MAQHLMIDIEGLATTPDATILTIAAQSFNPFGTGYYLDRNFYCRVTIESQEDREVNNETIEWWATQGAAQEEAFNEENRIPLEEALDGLYKLAWQHDFIWAQGPTYDINILEHAYRSRNKKQPWQFYKIRDCRSVISLWPDCPTPPTSHHALEDCRRQIERLQMTLKHLEIKDIK
jgi:hypothetical protein